MHLPFNPQMSQSSRPPDQRVVAALRRPGGAALVIVLACVISYANTLNVPFQFDDWSSIVANTRLSDLAGFVSSGLLLGNRAVGDLTFALNLAAHGTEVRGFHLVNGLIHVLNGLLVYALVRVTFQTPLLSGRGSAGGDRNVPWAALAAALVFVVHPVQTEAVTYVVQRYASLATLFILAAMLLYAEWRRSSRTRGVRRPALWAAAFASTVLAMRTKEIAFTLPLLLVLYEFLFFEGAPRRRLLALLPFVATMVLIPLTSFATYGSVADAKGVDAFAARALGSVEVSRADYLLTQLRVIVTYLRLLVLPVDQTIDHDVRLEHAFLGSPSVILSFLLLAALAGTGFALVRASSRLDRRLRIGGLGVWWFFITLSVESSLIPLDDVMVEHRLYLASVGFALALSAALTILCDRFAATPWVRGAAMAGTGAWIIALGAATVARNAVWGDAVTLWEDAVRKAPAKVRPHQNLGVAYAQRGWPAQAQREYELVVRLAPDGALGHYNLGHLYMRRGLTDAAIQEFRELLRVSPASPATRTTLATIYIQRGQLVAAARELEAALATDPDYAQARYQMELVQRQRPQPARTAPP